MKRINIALAACAAVLSVACGGEDPITADNVTLEQCQDLFPEDASTAGADEGAVEGDYDDDGDADEDDDAIEERCVELMEQGENGSGGSAE